MTEFLVSPQTPEFDPLKALARLKNHADWVGLRYMQESAQSRQVRNEKSEGQSYSLTRGVQIEVLVDGHMGYGSTSDLSEKGLLNCLERAKLTTQKAAARKVMNFDLSLRPKQVGQYQSTQKKSFDQLSLEQIISFLIKATQKLKYSNLVVNASASVSQLQADYHLVTTSGSDIKQSFQLWTSNFMAVAQQASETQRRTLNGSVSRCRQGGAEVLDFDFLTSQCEKVGAEAVELLSAENCPSDTRDLILMPDQMLLQIHESIGHPLEMDRILGDERNYAGWSFIEPHDFGKLRYGSSLMNVSFDPTIEGEFASYNFDDCGNPATREMLIENGILKRGLGSLESQKRMGQSGVANFRSASWNRAPIDRMANINLEPGTTKLDDMIKSVEKGVIMHANSSWSIDDYRNKFQFGCEYGQLIENGKITKTLKNPNYRGVTVPFWQSLSAVGTAAEVEVYGSPWCGKGEPSQVIRVGHSSPPCLFKNIEVFGGGK